MSLCVPTLTTSPPSIACRESVILHAELRRAYLPVRTIPDLLQSFVVFVCREEHYVGLVVGACLELLVKRGTQPLQVWGALYLYADVWDLDYLQGPRGHQ